MALSNDLNFGIQHLRRAPEYIPAVELENLRDVINDAHTHLEPLAVHSGRERPG